ncbi:MAG: hypothetical protein QXX38_00350 [Candidatus Aenigmatarchaeota archaeon]
MSEYSIENIKRISDECLRLVYGGFDSKKNDTLRRRVFSISLSTFPYNRQAENCLKEVKEEVRNAKYSPLNCHFLLEEIIRLVSY